MATLLKKSTSFDGFGPSILAQQMRGRLRRIDIPDDRFEARKLLRERCPMVPGVYGWLDCNNRLIYVGKSKSLRKRLLSYFAKTPADIKMERIRQNSQRMVWEPISHELLALIREQELIFRWRPEFNSMGQPTRMRPAFLCIDGLPAPNVRMVRKLTDKHLHAFGPIKGTGRLRDAVVSLNQVFNLRDCPDKTKFDFNDQQFLFDDPMTAKCIRYELGTCPGPCASKCNSNQYSMLVDNALGFLNGNSSSTLEKIEAKMQQAAERAAFESAAIYRDCLEHLTWLDRRLSSLRVANGNLNGVLQIAARRNRIAWLIIRGGQIIDTMVEPTTPAAAELVGSRISQLSDSTPGLVTDLLESSLQLIVISWFRKFPQMKEQILSFDQAIRYCEQKADSSAAA